MKGESNKASSIEIWVKIVGTLIAAGSLLLGAITYLNNSLEARRAEHFKTELLSYERQADLYSEVILATSRLAAFAEDSERTKARREFYSLYWGKVFLIPSSHVREIIDEFHGELESERIQSPDLLAEVEEHEYTRFLKRLQTISERLSVACADNLRSTRPTGINEREMSSSWWSFLFPAAATAA